MRVARGADAGDRRLQLVRHGLTRTPTAGPAAGRWRGWRAASAGGPTASIATAGPAIASVPLLALNGVGQRGVAAAGRRHRPDLHAAGRSEDPSPPAADRRRTAGTSAAPYGLREAGPTTILGDDRTRVVDHRERQPGDVRADPGDLPGHIGEVVLPHPVEVDREAERRPRAARAARPGTAGAPRPGSASRQIVASKTENRRRRAASRWMRRISIPATTGSNSTMTGNRFGPISPGIHAGRRSDRSRKTTASGFGTPAPGEERLRVRIAGERARRQVRTS